MAVPHSTWLHFTSIYHCSTLLYSVSNGSTSLYFTEPWVYFTELYFTSIMALLYFTMVLLHSTLLHITLPWLYFTLLYSTLVYHGSTSLYFTLPWLYCTLIYSRLFYHGSTSLFITLLYSLLLYHGSTSLYLILDYSTVALLHCTLLYHGSTWLYSMKREGRTTNEWEKLTMAAFHPWFSQHQVEWAQLPKSSTRSWPQWSQQNTTNATATHSTGSAVDSAFHYSALPLCAYVGLAPQLTAPPTHNYTKQPSIAPSATAEWPPDSDKKENNKLYNHHS